MVGAHTLARNQQISKKEARASDNFFTMLYMDGMSHSSRQAQTLMAETIDRHVSAGILINTVIQGEAAGTFLALARAGLVKADSNQQFSVLTRSEAVPQNLKTIADPLGQWIPAVTSTLSI